MQTRLALTIKHRGKAVPYRSREGSGSTNYGFRLLKGVRDPELQVPEARDDPALQDAIRRVNARDTSFFTVGCEKSFNHNDQGHWIRGYIEVSWNYKELVEDARHYFVPFFGFSCGIRDNRIDLPVHYNWELEGATFVDAGCEGWTVGIWLQTGDFRTASDARDCWSTALGFLSAYLEQVTPPFKATPIYASQNRVE